MFSLGQNPTSGRKELYGINVFKIREVLKTPSLTSVPGSPRFVVGMASLRGEIVPVIDLVAYAGNCCDHAKIMIVTEYNRRVQGFLVEDVDSIARIDWSEVKKPPEMLASGGFVSSITKLPGDRLAMIIELEQLLHAVLGEGVQNLRIPTMPVEELSSCKVLYVDDSGFARSQLKKALDAIGVRSESACDGEEAWSKLARHCNGDDAEPESRCYNVVIADVEMPGVDGLTLAQRIKTDDRLKEVKLLMHSSMDGRTSSERARKAGADAFLAKFDAEELTRALLNLFANKTPSLA